MKIVRLESENIKGIRAVEIEPDGSIVVVGGKNGRRFVGTDVRESQVELTTRRISEVQEVLF